MSNPIENISKNKNLIKINLNECSNEKFKFDSSKNPIHDPIANFYHEKDIKKEMSKNAITVKINPDIKISKKFYK